MTRDETVALFLECEARRAEARKVALDEGKSEDEAREIAHEAAKAHWNAWAEDVLAERKAMEAGGRWLAEEDWKGDFQAKNDATRDWFTRAKTDFSFCLFLNKGAMNEEREAETKAALEKRAAEAEGDVKAIPVDAVRTRFDGFMFHGSVFRLLA